LISDDAIIRILVKRFVIEMKANTHPSSCDANGIKSFRKNYSHLNIQKGLIIAPAIK
jgi:hypothetical protein